MNLELNNITFDYAGIPILAGVSGSITDGARIGVIGANGCGKSTLLGIIAGALEPTGGAITCSGDTRVAVVPQHLEAPGQMRVADLILEDALAARAALRAVETADRKSVV
jgi:ATPase subunit of ABC transporter with duplicated ATPase domains